MMSSSASRLSAQTSRITPFGFPFGLAGCSSEFGPGFPLPDGAIVAQKGCGAGFEKWRVLVGLFPLHYFK